MATQTAITINGQTLPVREYQGQRVVTVQDVAMVHNVPIRNVQINFERNKKHFISETDFYNLKGKKVINKLFVASKNVTQINVFTESGYLMLAKSLTDDLAWQVQRELVNSYFKLKKADNEHLQTPEIPQSNNHQITNIFELLEESYKRVIYYRLEKGLTQAETSKVLEISLSKLDKMEQNLKNIGVVLPKQKNNLAKYSLKNYKALSLVLEEK